MNSTEIIGDSIVHHQVWTSTKSGFAEKCIQDITAGMLRVSTSSYACLSTQVKNLEAVPTIVCTFFSVGGIIPQSILDITWSFKK